MQHLGQAPIARLWEAGKLQAAYRFLLEQVGDPAAATALLFGGMGYRPPFPADWAAASEMVLKDEASGLAAAELYVLSPHMCDVVVAAAQTLTREDLELTGGDDPPGMTGLVVLPHPILVRAVSGDVGDDRAFTWRLPSQMQRPSRDGRHLENMPAVRMSAYHDTHGPVRPDSFVQFAAEARAQGTPLPPLLLDAIKCLPLRYAATPEQKQASAEYVAGVRQSGEALRELAARHGLDESGVEGEYVPSDQIDDDDDTFMQRFLYAFWRLCDQNIATLAPAEVNHAAQVLASRAGVSPEARIVRLRRIEQSTGSPAAGREWHHRWVVRMHKVRQWYPSEQQHKVLYRGPYLKGPADKPLLEGETVRALIR